MREEDTRRLLDPQAEEEAKAEAAAAAAAASEAAAAAAMTAVPVTAAGAPAGKLLEVVSNEQLVLLAHQVRGGSTYLPHELLDSML